MRHLYAQYSVRVGIFVFKETMKHISEVLKENKKHQLDKLIEKYEPYMVWEEFMAQSPDVPELERVLYLLGHAVDDVAEEFIDKVLKLYGIPEDTTVELGIGKGFCNDWWWGAVNNFWVGRISKEELITFMEENSPADELAI